MNETNSTISAWETPTIAGILQQIHYQHITKKLKSLSIASEERSEGKTTVAFTIARGLTEVFKFKVLFVDLNPAGDSLLSKYLKDYHSDKGMVKDHVFPFSILRIRDLEVDWSKNNFDGPFLNRLITQYTSEYDIIIVDNYTPSQKENILKVNTDSNLLIKSPKSKTNFLEAEIQRDRKKIIGIVFNEI